MQSEIAEGAEVVIDDRLTGQGEQLGIRVDLEALAVFAQRPWVTSPLSVTFCRRGASPGRMKVIRRKSFTSRLCEALHRRFHRDISIKQRPVACTLQQKREIRSRVHSCTEIQARPAAFDQVARYIVSLQPRIETPCVFQVTATDLDQARASERVTFGRITAGKTCRQHITTWPRNCVASVGDSPPPCIEDVRICRCSSFREHDLARLVDRNGHRESSSSKSVARRQWLIAIACRSSSCR